MANDVLSIRDEKVMTKELDQLKKGLPYAEPLEKINLEIREVLMKKKEYSKKS